jgi:hypothetical protein
LQNFADVCGVVSIFEAKSKANGASVAKRALKGEYGTPKGRQEGHNVAVLELLVPLWVPFSPFSALFATEAPFALLLASKIDTNPQTSAKFCKDFQNLINNHCRQTQIKIVCILSLVSCTTSPATKRRVPKRWAAVPRR